jgi:hypothetical protein
MIGIFAQLLRSLANALDGHETRRERIRRRLMLA